MVIYPIGTTCKLMEQDGTEHLFAIKSCTVNCSYDSDVEYEVTMMPFEDFTYITSGIIKRNEKLKPKHVIFNPPATIVLWEDGTKTVVKCNKNDTFNNITGLALCYMKKALDNDSAKMHKALKDAKE